MAAGSSETLQVVLVRTHRCIHALPVEHVIEIMRPLPIDPVPEMPPCLHGLAVIRGEAVPVVDLGTLFGQPGTGVEGRFVLLRSSQRRVALAVAAVLGVVRLERSLHQDLPPLLQDVGADLVAAVGVRDQQLLLVLRSTRLVSDEVWHRLESRENAS